METKAALLRFCLVGAIIDTHSRRMYLGGCGEGGSSGGLVGGGDGGGGLGGCRISGDKLAGCGLGGGMGGSLPVSLSHTFSTMALGYAPVSQSFEPLLSWVTSCFANAPVPSG